jgi:hypothetical protein
MLERIGWWTFDAETQTLVNRASDQRVRFEGAVDDAGSLLHPAASGPARLRFSYQDADVRYPVLVIARYETYGGPGFDHGDSDRLLLILVGQSTISPQPRSGAAHVAPTQKSRLTACGGASTTPSSTP